MKVSLPRPEAGWAIAAALCALLVFAGARALQSAELSRDMIGEADKGPIRIVAGNLPPHMTDAGRGREAEIIRAAFRAVAPERPVEFHVTPFSRHWEAYRRDLRFQAVASVPTSMVKAMKGYESDVYITYQNGIFYRRADFRPNLREVARRTGRTPVAALGDKRLVAFAGAAGILPEVRAAIPSFESYAEYEDQYAHSMMLKRGFVDVIIADRLILDTYNSEVFGREYDSVSRGLAFLPAFCPTPYHLVFRTSGMRDRFDRGLAAIRASGELAQINARYRVGSNVREDAPPVLNCGTP